MLRQDNALHVSGARVADLDVVAAKMQVMFLEQDLTDLDVEAVTMLFMFLEQI